MPSLANQESEKIVNLRLKLIKGFVLPTCLLNPIYALLLAYGIKDDVNQVYLPYWIVAIIFTGFIWYLMYQLFERNILTGTRFVNTGALAGVCSGLIWGSVGLWGVEAANSAQFLYLCMILCFINVIPHLAVGIFPIIQNTFIVCCLLPLMINPFYYGVPEMYWMSAVIFWIVFGFILYGKRHSITVENTITLSEENKRLKEQVQLEKEEIERVSAAKTRFLAAASHDLRQPLQAQQFFVEALKLAKDPSQHDKLINSLQGSTLVLSDLLNSLLDISKLDADVVSTNITPVNINELFNRIKEEFKPLADKQNLQLRLLKTHLWVNSDQTLLENIIRNLVANSIRYSYKGHILIACSATNNNTFTLEVRDSGIGIDKEKLPYIFDEFYQINNDARDRNKGLGLGLSIVTRLCKLLTHPLSVDSHRNIGSRFYITLQSIKPPKTIVQKPVSSFNRLKGKTILIIDDDLLILESLGNLLDQWHCHVISAESGQEGVNNIKNTLPDAIISDFRLKNNETGLDAINLIYQVLNKKIPALLLTGETSPEKLSELDNSKILTLHKPIQPVQLRTALNNILISSND